MKPIISLISGIIAFIGVFYFDSIIINLIINSLPEAAAAWTGFIKIILWILAICWTTGIALLIGYLSGLGALIVLLFLTKTK